MKDDDKDKFGNIIELICTIAVIVLFYVLIVITRGGILPPWNIK